MKKSVIIVMFVMFMACLWLAVSVVESYGASWRSKLENEMLAVPKPIYPSTPVYDGGSGDRYRMQDHQNAVERYHDDLDQYEDRLDDLIESSDKVDDALCFGAGCEQGCVNAPLTPNQVVGANKVLLLVQIYLDICNKICYNTPMTRVQGEAVFYF